MSDSDVLSRAPDGDITGPGYSYMEVITSNMRTAQERILALAPLAPDMRVLEVKCSDPYLACTMAQQAASVIGLDDRAETIEASRKHSDSLGLGNVEWRQTDLETLPFADASFDLVVSRYLLHHAADPAATVAEMARVLKPGGRIVMVDSTPRTEAVDGLNHVERLRDPTHLGFSDLETLQGFGHDAGLTENGRGFYRIELLHTDKHAETMPEFIALLKEDAASGADAYDIQTYVAPDGIRYRVPNSILAWDKPAA